MGQLREGADVNSHPVSAAPKRVPVDGAGLFPAVPPADRRGGDELSVGETTERIYFAKLLLVRKHRRESLDHRYETWNRPSFGPRGSSGTGGVAGAAELMLHGVDAAAVARLFDE